MPSERAVLEMLTRNDLLLLVAHHQCDVADRRVREQLVAVLLRLKFRDVLAPLSAVSLKALVAECELTPESRKKEGLIDALARAATPRRKAVAAKKTPSKDKGRASEKTPRPDKSRTQHQPKLNKEPQPPSKTRAKTKVVALAKQAAPQKRATKKTSEATKPGPLKKKGFAKPEGTPPSKSGKTVAPDERSPEEAPATQKPGQISSWAEAALAAAARGQSAATMLKPVGPARHVHSNTRKCAACSEKLALRKCSVQACSHMLLADRQQKICAECRFERNTLSMTDFEEVLAEERTCPHCDKFWRKG